MSSSVPKISLGAERPQDPNVVQRRAADPSTSAWVSASAGTGKTKVLTDRVLRLLLPREDGSPGTPASKILCLTFTKAAANEMRLRLSKTLSEWAACDDLNLTNTLQKLIGRTPKSTEIIAARKLFAETTDVPGGLKIMTVHSFCQSVLGRFPLEAGIAPNFAALDESAARSLLSTAKTQTLSTIKKPGSDPALSQALDHIAEYVNEDDFSILLKSIASERRQLSIILKKNFGLDGLYEALRKALNIPAGQTPDNLLAIACKDTSFDKEGLLSACRTLLEGSESSDQPRGATIAAFLEKSVQERTAFYPQYKSAFLTEKQTIRAALITKPAQKSNPAALDTLQTEALRILQLEETLNAARCALLTRDLLMLANAILETYTTLKANQNALDFDDLINKTLDLMEASANSASWVLYKLDQGLDHILVDEAQDTNPEQWEIVKILCEEFFAGENAAEAERTLFTVGDEKQSIYSFQRASPEKFAAMHGYFEQKIKEAGKKWDTVPISTSFRSTHSVLQAVDAVFSIDALRSGVSHSPVSHSPAHERGHQQGIVELWPLCETQDAPQESDNFWEPPTTISTQQTSTSLLCEQITTRIENWLQSGEILASHNRPIRPGDIMILVRTRSALVSQLSRSLKNRNIPVGGLDRILLSNEIVIQDLLACAEFALLLTDDLTLACILKSPMIGLTEEELFALAHGRETSLWQALQQSPHTEITTYLKNLIAYSTTLRPYDFLCSLLYEPCPANGISGLQSIQIRLGEDTIDPILELLDLALNFEKDSGGHLQQFVQQMRNEAVEIKREQEDAGNHVRILTIHGAKGLQAPIVIMPDTIRSPGSGGSKPDSKILWPEKIETIDLPLWIPRKDMECASYTQAASLMKQREEEEYRRLLYVAMTRAEDRLYVCGQTGKKKPRDESWYFYVQQGLELTGAKTLKDGTLRLDNPQIRDPDRSASNKTIAADPIPLPAWLYKPAPTEPHPPRPLMPSRPSGVENPVLSPLQKSDEYRFYRGNITHKILQFLPETPQQNRSKTIQNFIAKSASDLPEKVQHSITQEIEAIMKHPDFAPIFGPGSKGEVPITGLTDDGRVISGQIDRLFITESEILIIDYKTNRPPPTNPKDVPQIYINQLRAYRDILAKIYPSHTIKCALLWTDGPNLMPISFDS